MESNHAAHLKIGQLLEKFLEPDGEPINDTSLNRLLTLFTDNEKNGNGPGIIDVPIFAQWLQQFAQNFNKSTVRPNIASFALKLTSFLSRDEAKFNVINTGNCINKLLETTGCRLYDAPPAVKMAYLRLISSCLDHDSGLRWLYQNSIWEDVYKLAITNQTLYVKRECTVCLAIFLEKMASFDTSDCDSIVKQITAPFYVIDGDYEVLKPTLQLMADVLDYNMEKSLSINNDRRVVNSLFQGEDLKNRIYDLLDKAENSPAYFDVCRMVLIVCCIDYYLRASNHEISETDTITLGTRIIFMVKALGTDIDGVLKLSEIGQFYANFLVDKIPHSTYDRDGKPFLLGQQLMAFQVVPVSVVSYKYYCKKMRPLECDLAADLREDFGYKIFKMLCPNTIRTVFQWRDLLLAQPNIFETATKSLTYMMRSRKYYSRERASIAFQTTVYVFKDCIESIKLQPDNFLIFSKQPAFWCMLMESILVFIEEFHITWRDSVEAICILGVTFDFLSFSSWPTQVVVKALKLVNVAIAKYMTPSLALLIDNTPDSMMIYVGPLLFAKLHDSQWEIRDTTLEVLCTIANMSNQKFPSFQKVLLDSEFPDLIVKMATEDGESYVRASAIKCLQEMIKVQEIWKKALNKHNLWEKMSKILLNETEGIVRIEAATFFCIAYENHQLPTDSLDRIYDLMIHASTVDLYWEVKVRALQFWDKVIKTLLQNEGMIDGTFPEVTFSKEHRKIVNLNHAEIRKRLFKVVEKLSSIGSLGALMSAVKDDCDVEVTKSAVEVLKPLVHLLKIYDVHVNEQMLPPTNGVSASSTTSSGISVDDSMVGSPSNVHCEYNDEILDQIINSRDVALLANMYIASDCDSVENYDIEVKKIVSPADFIQFTKQDLEKIVSEKQNWLNQLDSLESLLDDMLKSYRDDTNSMDCY